jgi:hypothetical protein
VDELTTWQAIRWWLVSHVWLPILGRCSWCESPLCDFGDERAGYTHFERTQRHGLGWVCFGCTEYTEG